MNHNVRRRPREHGSSLLELLLVASLVALLGSIGTALASEWRGRMRGISAARLLMAQVRLVRAQALREGTHVGLVFTQAADGALQFRTHRDGNGNGVRLADVRSGIDPPAGAPTRLEHWFPGTALAVRQDLPPIDSGAGVPAGSDPVRLSGGGSVLSCGPTGTTTSGTIYVAGARREALGIRVLGATGRVRLLEFDSQRARWEERW